MKFLLDSNTDINHTSSVGYAPLHIAVAKSNIDIVTLLLDQNVDTNSKTIDGKTPLHISVEKHEETIIQKLLEQKADINLKDALGNTVLHLAVQVMQETKSWLVKAGVNNRSHIPASHQLCSVQTVQAIIEHGGNVNAVNNRGQTPLWFACLDGQEELVKILLHKGADSNIADGNSDSSLHSAIYGQCSAGTIQEIINHGVHINATNEDGATPLLLACSTAQTESIRLLLKAKSDVNSADVHGDTSLHAAITAGCSNETLQEIIDNGGDVNAGNKRGRTALLLSCFYRHMDLVRVLLGAGADPTIADEEGFSCLHAAIDGRCCKDTPQELIYYSADTDAKRNDGTTALLCVCRTGQSESVRFLLEAGAGVNIAKPDGSTSLRTAVHGACSQEALQNIVQLGVNVNAINNNRQTALIRACETAQAESVTLLLKNKADPNIFDGRGYTSLHAAVHGNCTHDTLKKMVTHGAHLNKQDNLGRTALFLACKYRQQEMVKILLESAANPRITCTEGKSSLHVAVEGGCSKKIIRALIKHGVNVNATNVHGVTALMTACVKGNIETINILLSAGADPNIADSRGETCIHHVAFANNSKEAVQAIINHGAYINATNKENITAIMIACQMGYTDTMNVLLSAGADLNIADNTGATWICHAAIGGNKETLQAVINLGADVNTTNNNSKTVLMIACQKGHIDAMNVLLHAGADINSADNTGATWIHSAVIGDSKETLQAIINLGADVDTTNKHGVTALMIACSKGNIDIINILLNAGADHNITDTTGASWIHYAVDGGNKETLQAIINLDADINASNNESVTALMFTCRKGNTDIINVLLNAGADPNIADMNGKTWVHHAVTSDCSKEIVQSVIDLGADVNTTNNRNVTALMEACKEGNLDTIKTLLNAGADPNIADIDGHTWIHYAIIADNSKETVQSIVSLGADVNTTNNHSITALMIACMKGNIDAVDVLLHAGADPNIADTDVETLIHYAVQEDCSKEILQATIDHGADVNSTNMYGETALLIACKKGNIDAIHVLLNAGADPNIANAKDETCIHHAIVEGCSKETLQAIINHGADVNSTNKNNVTSLMTACENGNIDAIDVLLNAGANPNIADTESVTCIHHAVNGGCNKEILQAIINLVADINASNMDGETALLIACKKGNIDAIDILLNAGADPNIADSVGVTCIQHVVFEACSKETLQAIINHGADVNSTNKNNVTSLMTACENGNIDAIDVLLNAGANPNIADTEGVTCIHHAVNGGCNKEILQAIISLVADINASNMDGETALLIACQKGNIDAIDILLNAGADPNIADSVGVTCIQHVVFEACSKETLQAIINHGADVNSTNKNNVTSLMTACENGNIDAIDVLLNAGANPNIADTEGVTCIHHAVNGGCNKEILQAIISLVADINASNMDGETALLIACKKGNIDAIDILLNAGADPNIADSVGVTCIQHVVFEVCSKETLQAIISHGADVNATNKNNLTALMIACMKGNIDVINVLLNAGADHSIVDTDGKTWIHYAVRGGSSKETLQVIINHGADVNATNKNNLTALMIACMKGYIDAIDVLLSAGADPSIADTKGETWIHYAVQGDCSKEILQATIDHGADVNSTNMNGETALLVACKNGNIDAIDVLLNAGADPNNANAKDETCIHHAVFKDCSKETLQAIIDHGADVCSATNENNLTAFMIACQKGNINALNVLLNAGADRSIVDTKGETWIHYAVREGCSKETLQAIIDYGADVNATTNNNVTPLMIACKKGNIDAINVLLHAGADPSIADIDGETWIHYAVTWACGNETVQSIFDCLADFNATNEDELTALMTVCDKVNIVEIALNTRADLNIPNDDAGIWIDHAAYRNCNKEIFQAIIDHGADVNTTYKNNVTALMMACEKRNIDAIDVLLNAGADPNIADTDGDTCIHYAVIRGCNKEILQKIIDHGVDVCVFCLCIQTGLVEADIVIYA